jgi:hypothetical protein
VGVTPPPTGPPDPSTTPPPPPKAFGARTRVTVAPLRTRIAAGEPLRLRLRNGNDFVVRGRLRVSAAFHRGGRIRRAGLRERGLRLLPQARRDVAFALPAPLRAELRVHDVLRLAVTATLRDPAGNVRRITNRIVLRPESR